MSGGIIFAAAKRYILPLFLVVALGTVIYTFWLKKKQKGLIYSQYHETGQKAEEMERKSQVCDTEIREIVCEINRLNDGPEKQALRQKAREKLKEKKMYDKFAADLRQAERILQAAELLDRNNMTADLQTEIANVVQIAETVQNITENFTENLPEEDEAHLEADLDDGLKAELEAELAALIEHVI